MASPDLIPLPPQTFATILQFIHQLSPVSHADLMPKSYSTEMSIPMSKKCALDILKPTTSRVGFVYLPCSSYPVVSWRMNTLLFLMWVYYSQQSFWMLCKREKVPTLPYTFSRAQLWQALKNWRKRTAFLKKQIDDGNRPTKNNTYQMGGRCPLMNHWKKDFMVSINIYFSIYWKTPYFSLYSWGWNINQRRTPNKTAQSGVISTRGNWTIFLNLHSD